MEEEGTVSLWLGSSRSREALEKALEVSFSEDGDFLGSSFSRAFGIGYYDEGLREAEFFDEASSDLTELLRGASYERVVVDRFLRLAPANEGPFNSVVLLYNYRHQGRPSWTEDGVSLRFVGSVSYR